MKRDEEMVEKTQSMLRFEIVLPSDSGTCTL